MSVGTGIEWTEATWNPVAGCSRVSEGCRNCYAERLTARFSAPGMWGHGFAEMVDGKPRWTRLVALLPERLPIPLKRKKPTLWFVDSRSDLFHEKLPFEDIAAVFGIMSACPRHQFQVLTKRPQRMVEFFQWVTERGHLHSPHLDGLLPAEELARQCTWPLPNVWLGVSVENQAAADERIPLLLATPAAVRFLSCEPLLEEIDLARWLEQMDLNDWVIAGDESGIGRRDVSVSGAAVEPPRTNAEWAFLHLRRACIAPGVPFFMKQIHHENDHFVRCWRGRKLEFWEFFHELQVREMPLAWHTWAERYRPELLEARQ
jgi:protein gp37